MEMLKIAAGYSAYFLRAKTKHDVHSPFVYNLLTNVINKKTESSSTLMQIELLRKEMTASKKIINVTDYGAGSSKYSNGKKLNEIVSQSAKSKKYASLLYRLVQHFKPQTVIELGTSLGISAMYMASANAGGCVYTIEGSAETAKIAQQNFNRLGFKNIYLHTGQFENTLPQIIKSCSSVDFAFIDGNHRHKATLEYFNLLLSSVHEKTILVFDDINYSSEMRAAWKKIISDPRISASIDLFMMGIVFTDTNLSKQHFELRF